MRGNVLTHPESKVVEKAIDAKTVDAHKNHSEKLVAASTSPLKEKGTVATAVIPKTEEKKESALTKVDNQKGGTLVKAVLPKGWYAQVAAPKGLADAEAMGKKLKSAGFSVVVERAEVRSEQYFRLLVGPEATKATAERLIAQLKREKSIKTDPFLRMVK